MLEALRRLGGGRRARGLESVRTGQPESSTHELAFSAVEKALAEPLKIEATGDVSRSESVTFHEDDEADRAQGSVPNSVEVRHSAPSTDGHSLETSPPSAPAPKPAPVEKGRTIEVPEVSSSSPEYHAELADSMLKLLEEREERTESSIKRLDAEYEAERQRREEEYRTSRERLTEELEGIRCSEKFYRAAPELLYGVKEKPEELETKGAAEAPPVALKRAPRRRSRARKTGEAAS